MKNIKKIISIMLSIVLAFPVINNNKAYAGISTSDNSIEGEWNTLSNMASKRYAAGISEISGNIYAIGGSYGSTYYNTIEEYDPLDNTWTSRQPMVYRRAGLGTAVLNGRIYAIGGRYYNSTDGNSYYPYVEEYNTESNTWITKKPMSKGRYGLGVVAVNGKIYAIGGYNGSSLNIVEEYDPETDTWTTKSPMPTSRYNFGAAVLNGKIYVIGGQTSSSSSSITSKVEEYDPVNDTWTDNGNVTTPRSDFAVAAVGNKILLIGGKDNSGTSLNTVEEYDPVENTCITRSGISHATYGIRAEALNNKVFAVGGYYSNAAQVYILASPDNVPEIPDNLSGTETSTSLTLTWNFVPYAKSYDIEKDGSIVASVTTNQYIDSDASLGERHEYRVRAANIAGDSGWSNIYVNASSSGVLGEWNTLSNMSSNRYAAGISEISGRIYAIGGSSGSTYYNTIEEYDPLNNTWTSRKSMTYRRAGLGTAVLNGRIYAIGGKYSSSYYAYVEEYNPENDMWITKNPMSKGRYGLGVVSANGKIYAIGGYSGSSLNIVEEYSPQTDTWATKSPMPTARYNFGAAVLNGKIYVIGGQTSTNSTSSINKVEEYDPVNDTWTDKGNVTIPRSDFAVAAVGNKILLIGGKNNSGTSLNTVEEYDPVENTCITRPGISNTIYGIRAASLNDKVYAVGGYNSNAAQVYILATPENIPGTPDNLSGTETGTSLTLTWNFVPYAKSYDVEKDGSIVASVATNQYIDTDTALGERHEYRIRAANIAGDSDWSNIYENASSSGVIGEWITLSNMASNRYTAGILETSGKIYAIGGSYGSTYYNTIEEYDPLNNTWTSRQPMAYRRTGLGTAVLNGRIYAIGGKYYNSTDGNSYYTYVEEYNAESNTWITKKPMSKGRYGLGVVSANGKIYAIGGYSGSSLNIVEEYNPQTDTWTTKSPMLTSRYNFGAVVLNGKIYVIGGQTSSSSSSITSKVEEYDPVNDTWTDNGSVTTPRSDFAVAAVGNKILLIGGKDNSGTSLNTVEEYDPVENACIIRPGISNAAYGIRAAALNNKVFTVGGYSSNAAQVYILASPDNIPEIPDNLSGTETSTSLTLTWNCVPYAKSYIVEKNGVIAAETSDNSYSDNEIETGGEYQYRIRAKNIAGLSEWSNVYINSSSSGITGEWITLASMGSKRYEPGVAEANGKLYAIGGYDGTNRLNTIEEYDPLYNLWISKSSMSNKREGLGAAEVNGKIYAIGGYDGSAYLNSVEEYDPAANLWNTKKSMINKRQGLGIAVVNKKIYAIGGKSSSSNYLGVVEEYDPQSDLWTSKKSMPTSRSNFGVAVIDGEIYVIGGHNTSGTLSKVEKYNPLNDTWTDMGSILTPRESFAIAALENEAVTALDNRVLLIGGKNGSSLNTVEEYELINKTQVLRQSISTANYGMKAVSAGNKVYTIGGYNSNLAQAYILAAQENIPDVPSNFKGTESSGAITLTWDRVTLAKSYDIEKDGTVVANIIDNSYIDNELVSGTSHQYRVRSKNIAGESNWSNIYISSVESVVFNNWITKSDLLTARYGLGSTNVGEKIYVFGGYDGSNYLDTVEEYSSLENKWTTKSSLPTARKNASVVSVDNLVYVLGGYNGEQLDMVNVFDPASDSWSQVNSMIRPRSSFGAASVNGKIYVFGGKDEAGNYITSVDEYDPSTDQWIEKTAIPTERIEFSVAVIDNMIYLIGGYSNEGYLKTVETYDPEQNVWSEKAGMEIPRSGLSTIGIQGRIYAVGGKNSGYVKTVEEYNPKTNTWAVKADIQTARAYFGISSLKSGIFIIGGYNGSVSADVEALNIITPQTYIADILNRINRYSDANEEEKNAVFSYFMLDRKKYEPIITNCDVNGDSLSKTVNIAVLHKAYSSKYGITITDLENLYDKYKDISKVIDELCKMDFYIVNEGFSIPRAQEAKSLLVSGYSADNIRSAYIASEALNITNMSQIIRNDSLSSSADTGVNISDDANKLAVQYNIDPAGLQTYMQQNSITAVEISQRVQDYQYDRAASSAKYLEPQTLSTIKDLESTEDMKLAASSQNLSNTSSTTGEDEEIDYKQHIEDAFNNGKFSNADVSAATGSLSYQQALLSLPGINGLDLTISASYESGKAGIKDVDYVKNVSYKTVFPVYRRYDTYICTPFGDSQFIEKTLKSTTEEEIAQCKNENEAKLLVKDKEANGYSGEEIEAIEGSDSYIKKCYSLYYGKGKTISSDDYADYIKDNYDAVHSKVGLGWKLSFSSVEFDTSKSPAVPSVLHLGDGRAFKLKGSLRSDGYNLKDYKLKDIQFFKDTSYLDSSNNYASSYILKYKDGKKEYFDANGTLLAIADRYGNKIIFKHQDYEGIPVISEIKDTIGRVISISYNSDRVVITAPNGNSIVLKLEDDLEVIQNQLSQETYNFKLLKDIITKSKEGNSSTTSFNYTIDKGRYSFSSNENIAQNENAFADIIKIIYPTGAYTEYAYDVNFKGKLGPTGCQEYYVVKEKYSYPYKEGTQDNNPNKVVYQYTGSYTDTEGYSTSIIDSEDSFSKISFNERHRKTMEETYELIEKSGDSNKIAVTISKQSDSFVISDIKHVINSTENYVSIAWDKVSGATGYTVYRSNSIGGQYAVVKELSTGLSACSFIVKDNNIANGYMYFYKITAKVSGIIKSSNIASIEARLFQAGRPYISQIKQDESKDNITLIWNEIDWATGYVVKRAEDEDGPYTIVANNIHDAKYIDRSIGDGVTYYYRVYSIKARKLSQISYAYDSYSHIKSETTTMYSYDRDTGKEHKWLKTVNYSYNEYGDLLKNSDTSNAKTVYNYDFSLSPFHQPTSITKYISNSKMQTAKYLVDKANGNVNSMTMTHIENGKNKDIRTDYEYFADGRVKKEVITNLQKKDDGSYITVNGAVQQYDNYKCVEKDYLYNEVSFNTKRANETVTMIKTAYPDGGTQDVTSKEIYDFNTGEIIAQFDNHGHKTEYEYDYLGRLIKITNPILDNNKVTSKKIAYYGVDLSSDDPNPKSELIDETGYRIMNIYDGLGRIVSKQEVSIVNDANIYKQLEQTVYNSKGQVESTKDANGNVTSYEYDGLGRLIKTIYPKESDMAQNPFELVEYSYKGGNNVKIEYDEEQVPHYYYYDAADRVIKEQVSRDDNTLNTINYSYNYLGLLTSKMELKKNSDGEDDERNSPVTKYIYDDLGRLTEVKDALGQSTFYQYDNLNNIVKTTTAGGSITERYYDESGRQIKEKVVRVDKTGVSPIEQIRTINYFDYDDTDNAYGTGNIIISTDSMGQMTRSVYDKQDRMIKQTIEDASKVIKSSYTYEYNDNGSTKSITDDITKKSEVYDYYPVGRIKSVQYKTNGITEKTITYDYDMNGNKTYVDSYGKAVYYEYDTRNRLKSVTSDYKKTLYEYYPDGSRKRVSYGISTLTITPAVITPSNPKERSTWYTYEEYTYDDLNNLIKLENRRTDGTNNILINSYSYSYDEFGNQTSKTDEKGNTVYSYDKLNRVKEVIEPNGSITTFDYDGNGNITKKTTSYKDASGAVKTDTKAYYYNNLSYLLVVTEGTNKTTYDYDKNGNMISTKDETTKQVKCDYRYNAANQLIGLLDYVNNKNVSYKYYPDGLREEQSIGNIGTAEENIARYLYDGDNVAAEADKDGKITVRNLMGINPIAREYNGITLYYLYNGHADVVGMVDVQGQIVNSYYYDIYGNIKEANEAAGNENPIRYAGQYYDTSSDLYYLRARYYDPGLMRFITEDTNKGDVKDPLSLNLYAYCQGNPINLVDADGHAPKMLNNEGGFIGAGYGGGGGAFLLWAMNMASKLPPDTFEDILNIAYDIYTRDMESLAIDVSMLPLNDGINFRFKGTGRASSKVLRQNLIDAGIEVPDYANAAHHIVAGTSQKANEARAILQKYGIDINDASNGVFLPTANGLSNSSYHPGLHTNTYYNKVNDMLKGATSKNDVLDILDDIAEQLSNGTFMK